MGFLIAPHDRARRAGPLEALGWATVSAGTSGPVDDGLRRRGVIRRTLDRFPAVRHLSRFITRAGEPLSRDRAIPNGLLGRSEDHHMEVQPVTLEGEHVRLEPLSMDDHLDGLRAAAENTDVFRWFSRDWTGAMVDFVTAALEDRDAGTAVPFATVRRASGEVIGSTRFCRAAPAHRRVEIGWTWLAPAHQRTAANTEAKYLMLGHAFESWGCLRVELKTDSRNDRSRAAIRRIGATQEGTLRKHMQTHQGTRDTVYYSVIDEEWSAVKRDLEGMLDRQSNARHPDGSDRG